MIVWYIEHDLGLEKALNKKQYWFRKGCSTEAAPHKLIHMIERRIAKKGFVLGTFLDIELPLTIFPSVPLKSYRKI